MFLKLPQKNTLNRHLKFYQYHLIHAALLRLSNIIFTRVEIGARVAKDPAFRAGGANLQMEPIAVTVAAVRFKCCTRRTESG